ncbi:uncharacterized protein [Parasteatoda tepidariorum]|nr:uncharacterized protein LOC107450561 isoform X2 [Parasteatoda tepidariorum]
MVALKNKNTIEVQNIVLDLTDIQRKAFRCIENEKELVADKKSKVTKSVILCRWMTCKPKDDKDVTSLCAHWFNNGIKPKNMSNWLGMNIVEQSGHFAFSEKIQKWCYPKKEATWRKPKNTLPKRLVENVKECDFEKPCEVCDSNFAFSSWESLDNVVKNNLAPKTPGLYQLSVKCGKTREVVEIAFDYLDSSNSKFKCLDAAIRGHKNSLLNLDAHNRGKFKNKDAVTEIRWLEVQNMDNENSCFLWAHWFNAHKLPMLHTILPGKKQLEKHQNFVLREKDKKWCYVVDELKQNKMSRFASKQRMRNDLEEDIRFAQTHCS